MDAALQVGYSRGKEVGMDVYQPRRWIGRAVQQEGKYEEAFGVVFEIYLIFSG